MEAKLLCVGDMHLGRRPSQLPVGLGDFGLDASLLTPAAAWRRVVEFAISARVDAVLLAGDVVQSDNRFFEAFGVLERGIRDLSTAGIHVVAVAGNHDVDVLPRLADEIAGFHLLGRGGRWEAHDLARDGRTFARIVGWSFPRQAVDRTPLESFDASIALDRSVPRIGLLHCDLDVGASRYAPVARRELELCALDAWLLGHIHKPSLADGTPPIGYLGSLQGLDPSETGVHGPWIVRIDGANTLQIEHVPLAPLRWEAIDIAVEGLGSIDEIRSCAARALTDVHRKVASESSRPLAVGCRLRFTGRSPHSAELRRVVASREIESLRRPIDDILYFVERATTEVEPAIDLAELARQDDPPGLLARRILALQRAGSARDSLASSPALSTPAASTSAVRTMSAQTLSAQAPAVDSADSDALTHAARKGLQRVVDQPAWQSLEAVDLGDAAVRARLIRVAMRALEDLLAQTETSA